MNSKDYYGLLKIDRSATDDDIKKAYRKLAMEFHPDVNTGKDAEGKFKALSEAYSVLSDSRRRQAYDQTGTTDFSNTANRPFQRGRGMGRCNGMGMGKCSGLYAAMRRPARYARKTSPPGSLSE